MHRLLQRVLKKNGLNNEEPPSREKWSAFLEKMDEIFNSNDEDRYLLERSLEISSREMEELLEASRESFQQRITALTKVIPDLIFYVDEEGRYLDIISQGREDMLFLPREEIIGRTMQEIFPREYASKFMEATLKAIETNRLTVITYDMRGKSGKRFFEARIMPTNIKENGKRTSIAIVRDMTAERKSIDYLNVIKKIFEDATEGIFIVSAENHYMEANDAFCRMLGVSKEELPGGRLRDYAHFFDKETMDRIVRMMEEKNFFNGEVKIHKPDGLELLAWLTIDTVFSDEGEEAYHVAMLTDISELQKSREQLHFTATHDVLTKLPNRTLLFQHLEEALERSRTREHGGALLFIDLDNFKEINDTVGHSAGDRVLLECARRIRQSLREGDIFGRLGGDEFLLIIENIDNMDVPMHVAKKVIEELHRPFHVGNDVFELGASIGIALFPEDSREKGELIQYADMAMYRAKEKGKNRFMYYSRALDQDVKRHYRIERALKEALSTGGFHLHYQPQIDLATGEVVAFEALLRLRESELGLLSPAEFIPVAEESDLIVKIGQWVFDEVCRQIVKWKEEGITPPLIGINLSRRQLMDEGFCGDVRETVSRYGLSPSSIEFEITETTFMHSRKTGYQVIKELQEMGFGLSIDDFGTGYSSLANLKQFTVDKLKIDRSFVRDMISNESDRAIIKASIALAKALSLGTVAEGVETAEQMRLLKEMECDEIQGFYFSPPISPDEVVKFLR